MNSQYKVVFLNENMIIHLSSEIYYITLARLFVAFGYTMSYVFIPVYLLEVKKLSSTFIGMISGISTLIGLTSWFFVNLLSNFFGERKVILISFAIRTLIFFMIGLFIYFDFSYIALIPLLLINSFLLSLSVSPMESLVMQKSSPANRNIAFSIHRIGMNIGWSFGPLLGGFLVEYDYSIPFFGTSLLTILTLILFSFFIKDEPKIQKSNQIKEDYKNFFNNKILVLFLINSIHIFIVMSLLITPLSVFITHYYSVSKISLGKIYFLNGIMVVLLQLPISVWFKNLFYSIQLGTFFYFLGYLSIGIFSQFHLPFSCLYLSVIVITLGELLSISSLHSFISILADKTNQNINTHSLNNFVSSYLGLIRTIGWSIGPIFSGLIQDFFSEDPLWIWIFSPITAIFAIFINFYLWKHYKIKQIYQI